MKMVPVLMLPDIKNHLFLYKKANHCAYQAVFNNQTNKSINKT